MNDKALLTALRQSADATAVDRIEQVIERGADRDLNRINVLAFAAKQGLDPQVVIAAFLKAAQLGLFEMSWNVLCPSCGGVLGASDTLKAVDRERYHCSFCAAGYEPTLDEIVEVTFTVSPRLRRIAAHTSDELSPAEFYRQMFWSSGVDLPDDLEARIGDLTLDLIELASGEKAFLSLHLPPKLVIIFDPVTHATQYIEVKGEPARERQNLSMVITREVPQTRRSQCAPDRYVSGEPYRRESFTGSVGGRSGAGRSSEAPSTIPYGEAAPDEPDLPRHLPG